MNISLRRAVTLLILAALLITASMASWATTAKDKFLYMQFNHQTVIILSSIPCPMAQYQETYPWSAMAVRSDNAVLLGCFGPNASNPKLVSIQWQPIGGKESEPSHFDADGFYPTKPQMLEDMEQNKAKSKQEKQPKTYL